MSLFTDISLQLFANDYDIPGTYQYGRKESHFPEILLGFLLSV